MEDGEQTAIFLFPESQEASDVDPMQRDGGRTQICTLGRVRRGADDPFVYTMNTCMSFYCHMLLLSLRLDVGLTHCVVILYIFLVSHVDNDLNDGCNSLRFDALLYPVFFDKYDMLLLEY